MHPMAVSNATEVWSKGTC